MHNYDCQHRWYFQIPDYNIIIIFLIFLKIPRPKEEVLRRVIQENYGRVLK